MSKAKKKTQTPKAEGKKKFRVKWELASTFLLKGWQLVGIEGKGKQMTAVLQAK